MDDCSAENSEMAKEYCEEIICQVKESLEKCDWPEFKKIDGIQRLKRRLVPELKYLESLLKLERLPISRVYSSNYAHLCSLTQVALSTANTCAVLKAFKLGDEKLIVDIVTDDSWIKIVSRNAQSVHMIWAGVRKENQKSIVDCIEEYFEAAKVYLPSFERQKFRIVAHFAKGVTDPVAEALRKMGTVVEGTVVDVDQKTRGFCVDLSDEEDVEDEERPVYNLESLQLPDIDETRVNLDVTTLTCFVSELTNGSAIPVFDSEYHEIPAAQERAQRLLPKLREFVGDKKMIVCKSAFELMDRIVNTVGGPNEKSRWDSFIKEFELVEDCPTDRAMQLSNSNRISDRSKIIFGTGDYLRVVTMTSNWGFVRAAQLQGVVFAVWQHDSFPLTMLRFLNQLKRRRRHELKSISTKQDASQNSPSIN